MFTREEVIEQAIDRWTTYNRLCRMAMASVRDSMVENYVKHAIEAKSTAAPTETFGGMKFTPGESLAASLQASITSKSDMK